MDAFFVSADSRGDSSEEGWQVGMLEGLKVPERRGAEVLRGNGEASWMEARAKHREW